MIEVVSIAGIHSADLGIAASNINGVIAFIYNILDVILYIGAAIMGMSGLMKYRLHRQNPQQIPLSTPVTELSIAGVLIILAVLAELSTSYTTVEKPHLPGKVTGQHAPAPKPPASGGYPTF